jgi:hypothetical protein
MVPQHAGICVKLIKLRAPFTGSMKGQNNESLAEILLTRRDSAYR